MTISTLAALAAILLFPSAMIFAALSDVSTMRISNRLVLLLLGSYALLAPLAGIGLHQFGLDAAVVTIIFVAAFACFAMGWIGGGDAKLATVIALWLGADHALAFVFYAALLGGLFTVGLLFFRTVLLPPSWYGQEWIVRLHAGESGVPYGVALGTAALIVFPDTIWMAAWAR